MIGFGLGASGGEITALDARWMFNDDPESVPGVAYKMIVADTFFVVADCSFKL
jgi:hypothetical protein